MSSSTRSTSFIFKNLAELLRRYRDYYRLTQEQLAELLAIELRTLQRWEVIDDTKRKPLDPERLKAIAKGMSVPYPALALLNAGAEVRYDLRTRAYAIPGDRGAAAAIARGILQNEGVRSAVSCAEPILHEDHAHAIHGFDMSIYPSDRPISEKVYLAAGRMLPKLNVILKDGRGLHCGHFVGIPLRRSIHAQMRENQIGEGDLRVSDLCPMESPEGGVLYLCSIFATHPSVGGYLYRNFATMLVEWEKFFPKNNFLLTAYAVTNDGVDYCRELGFTEVFTNPEEMKTYKTDALPTFFEMPMTECVVRNLHRWQG